MNNSILQYDQLSTALKSRFPQIADVQNDGANIMHGPDYRMLGYTRTARLFRPDEYHEREQVFFSPELRIKFRDGNKITVKPELVFDRISSSSFATDSVRHEINVPETIEKLFDLISGYLDSSVNPDNST